MRFGRGRRRFVSPDFFLFVGRDNVVVDVVVDVVVVDDDVGGGEVDTAKFIR